jgi:hypothetical protein
MNLNALDVLQKKTGHPQLLVHELFKKRDDVFASEDLTTDARRRLPKGTSNDGTRERRDWTAFHEEAEWQKLVRNDRYDLSQL